MVSYRFIWKYKNLNYEDKYDIYRRYARLKSSGTAHEWQQLISKGKYDLIRFETIHGRALTILARSKFLIIIIFGKSLQNGLQPIQQII